MPCATIFAMLKCSNPREKECLSISFLELYASTNIKDTEQYMRGTLANFTGVQLMNVTCGQLLTSFTFWQLTANIPGVTIENLLYGFSLNTYAKVLIGLSMFLS